MNPIVSCLFRRVPSLALLVLLLRSAPAVSAQTQEGQPSYQAPGLRVILKAQPYSALVRVRYESNNPGPVYVEFLNDQRLVVYTERKRETYFAGDYDLSPLPAGDYALHVFTCGFHHVEAVRITHDKQSSATVQVITPTAFQPASHSLFSSADPK
jgi:hypothetical protein